MSDENMGAMDAETAGIVEALENEAALIAGEQAKQAEAEALADGEPAGWFRQPVAASGEAEAFAAFLAGVGVPAVHGWMGIERGADGQDAMVADVAAGLAPVVEKYKGEPPAWLRALVDSYREEIGLAVVLAGAAWGTWQMHQAAQAEKQDDATGSPAEPVQVAEPAGAGDAPADDAPPPPAPSPLVSGSVKPRRGKR